ncbi:MAG TPA: glutathione S-transferase family protein [Magnetospirillaceae bacterium]|jgi:glutathione S-transferase
MAVQHPMLVIGTKSWSSWSLRPWLALKQAGVTFDEVVIRLRQPDTAANILKYSPSGKLPFLRDGEVSIWDSLAICEYVAEMLPGAWLWPEDRSARAMARSIAAEMHSGFMGLREHLSMDVTTTLPLPNLPDTAKADIARVQAMWIDCRKRFGEAGPFLFGKFTVADAMYAPVATRFRTYGVPLDPVCRAYVDAIYALPAMKEWIAAAEKEAA